jgi:Tol biopolymer transport system component
MGSPRRPDPLRTAAVGLIAGLAAALPSLGHAQYFGGNKVRYESQDFRVLESEHFDIYTYPEEDTNSAEAAVMMERWNHRLEVLLDHELRGRQPLILYAGHPHFRQTNATPGAIGEGTGGFTEMFKRRIVLPFTGAPRETDHVLGHELVHAFQFDISRKVTESAQDRASGTPALRLPLWFIEGMAEYLSIGSVDPHTAMWLRDSVLHDDLPTIADLGKSKYFPYRYGHAFWAYVAGRFGDDVVPRMLRSASRTGEVTRTLRAELKMDPKELSKDWHESLRATYGPALATGHTAAELGRAVVPAKRAKGSINVAPSLSPDGKYMLFFSERELFSIELYLVEVDTGKVVRRLTSAATDPHLDSLQFLSSAGSWSPDGKRVVIGSVGAGRPELAIIDVDTGGTVETHRFEELVEILHPAWSPDGKQIAFAGSIGGVLQLFVLDLATKAHRALTSGGYASMQPAWSPDGERLAFVTDRFTADAQRLTFGEYRLAVVELATGEIQPVPDLEGGKNINPQFSPDGVHLYFLSDAYGGPDLYRIGLATGAIEAMTDLKTGISGITRLSPALSVASRASNRIAASVFDKGMYHIYLVENVRTRSVAARRDPAAPAPGALPPLERASKKVDTVLAEAVPEREAVTTKGPGDYKPRLGIDYVGQVSVGVGTNSQGTAVGGGVSMYWSDMLGDHNLLTALQFEGDSETVDRNLTAIVNYENREHRWRWGVAAGQIPSLSLAYDSMVSGSLLTERLIRQWQINREVAARTAYPLTRADRFEASVGYRHVGYVTDALVQVVDLNTGLIVATGVEDLPSPDSIEFWPVGVAFVHDTSLFGGTAPVSGRRFRIEAGGTVGNLSFWSPLVDFRQYYMPWPLLSLAGRVLHFGRYGEDAEDPRIGEVFLGSATLVRGYNSSSFSVNECDDPSGLSCPVFDQLFGSRVVVTNVEARVPLFGARGLVATPQVPPIDIAAFYDAGVAWTEDEEAAFLGGTREFVRSYGATLRVSFFGALVLQWNYAKPLDRPGQDWYWQFLIAPGF